MPTVPAANTDVTPSRIDDVELLRPLAVGATSIVYVGRHSDHEDLVAVKLLTTRDDSARRGFLRERTLAQRVDHPAVVRTLDSGSCAEGEYLLMELVAGFSLQDFLERQGERPAAPGVRLSALTDTAHALSAVHDAGIVHRDLKPANLLFTRGGALKLTDFGAATTGTESEDGQSVLIGSAAYLAPELLAKPSIHDPRTDLYSLGVIAYQLCYGRLPFDGNARDVLAHRRERDVELPETDASLGWRPLLGRLLHRDPDARPQSAEQVAEELEQIRSDRRIATA